MEGSQVRISSKTIARVTSAGLHLDAQFMRLHGLETSGGPLMQSVRKPVENTTREFSMEELGKLNGSDIVDLLLN